MQSLAEELRRRRETESGFCRVIKEYGSVLAELEASRAAFRALFFEVEQLRRRLDQVIEREEAIEHAAKLEKRAIELQREVATARAAQQLAVSSAKNAGIEALAARDANAHLQKEADTALASAAAYSAKWHESESALTVAMRERELSRRQLKESEEEGTLLKRQNDELVLRLVDDKQRLVTEMNSMNEMIAKLSRENRLLRDLQASDNTKAAAGTGDFGAQNFNRQKNLSLKLSTDDQHDTTHRWETLSAISEMSRARPCLMAHEQCEIHEISFEAEEGDFLWTASSDGSARRVDLQAGSTLNNAARFLSPQSAAVLTVDVIRNIVATASSDRAIRILDASTGRLRLQVENAHGAKIFCVRLSADGRSIFSASADRCLKMWDLRSSSTSRPAKTLRTSSACHAICRGPFCQSVIDSGHRDGFLRSWDLRSSTDSPCSEIEGSAPVLGLVRSKTALVALRRDATVHVYDPATCGRLALLSHEQFQIHSSTQSARPALSPDGSHLAVPSSLGGCLVFDLSTGLAACLLGFDRKATSSSPTHHISATTSVAWSKRGLLVSADKGGSLSFWH